MARSTSEPTSRACSYTTRWDSPAWCEAGRSRTFEGRPGIVDAAVQALERASEPARSLLVDRLGELEDTHLQEIFEVVPPDRMSRSAGTFATEVIRINRDRLLERLT